MTIELNSVKTGAWKELQLTFHNFKVIENLGMKYPTEKSKDKKRFVKVECIICGKKYEGRYELYKNRDKVCTCETKKGKGYPRRSNDDRDRILKILNGMIYRCTSPNTPAYKNYGGRGITVCNEWINDKESFYHWAMQNGYKDKLSIERIDVNKGYCPENCTWIPLVEQVLNTRVRWTEEDKIKVRQMLKEGMSHREINRITGKSRMIISQLAKE